MGHTSRAAFAALLTAVLVVAGLASPASAAVLDTPSLRLGAVTVTEVGKRTALTVSWVHDGAPVTGTVNLQRLTGSGTWQQVRSVPVVAGAATTFLAPISTYTYRLRASSATSPAGVPTSHPAGTSNSVRIQVLAGQLRTSPPTLSGPVMVGGDGAARLDIAWYRGSTPLDGRVALQRNTGSGFAHVRYVQVEDGVARTAITVPTTAVFRLRASSVSSSGLWTSHPYGTSNELRVSVPSPTPSSFIVRGSGWGHGVGMSQYGAYGMALDGYSSTQILKHFYTGATVTYGPVEDPVVLVQVLGGKSSTTTRTPLGAARLILRDPGETDVRISVPKDTPVTYTKVTAGISVKVGTQPAVTVSSAGTVFYEWAATRYYLPATSVDVVTDLSGAQGRYRHGRLEMTVINGKLNATNRVKISDEYMYGIAEVPSSWPVYALRAQAVAARSYAFAGKASSVKDDCGCHLYDSVKSQNYTGWKKEGEPTWGVRWKAAVDATISSTGRGHILAADGGVITAFYFSSSGGRTENSEDVWSSALSYARSVSDPWSLDADINPNASWAATVSQSSMRTAFGLPDVMSVRIVSRTEGLAADVIRATSRSGATADLTGQQLRSRLGLKSAWIRSAGGVS